MNLSLVFALAYVSSAFAFVPSRPTFGAHDLSLSAKKKDGKTKNAEKAVKSKPVAESKTAVKVDAPKSKSKSKPEPVVDLTKKYAAMNEDDRAFAIMVDLGIVSITPDPDAADYDSSKDDAFCSDYDE